MNKYICNTKYNKKNNIFLISVAYLTKLSFITAGNCSNPRWVNY